MASALPPPQSCGSEESAIDCCVPLANVCSGERIHYSQLRAMVKVVCTSSSCDQSGFVHPDCFEKVEQNLIRYVTNYQFSNSKKQQNMKKYNWKDPHVREGLWKQSIPEVSSLVSRQVSCKCGQGYLRKDVSWPPSNWRKMPGKKSKTKSKDSCLPQLNNVGGGIVQYVFHKEESRVSQDASGEGGRNIPGAVFVTQEKIKRGEIVEWNVVKGVGYIRNMENDGERLCVAEVGQFEGVRGVVWDQLVGKRVEYTTKRKGKKLVAVSVRLQGGNNRAEGLQPELRNTGVVTHWVPSQLAGVLATPEYGEVIVQRNQFIPGGFVPDIVGKTVKFNRVDLDTMEALDVRVESGMGGIVMSKESKVKLPDLENLNLANLGTEFSEQDLKTFPLLMKAVEADQTGFHQTLARGMSELEQRELLDQLEPFLVPLSTHKSGHLTVVEMIKNFAPPHLSRLLTTLAREFFHISDTQHGSKVVISGLLHINLDTNLLSTYSEARPEDLTVHFTGDWSSKVFETALPLLGPAQLRPLVLLLPLQPGPFLQHPSLRLLVRQVARTDLSTLHLLAARLDTEHMLLSPPHIPLVCEMLASRSVRVTSLVLHQVSGRLATLLPFYHDLLASLLKHATELQLELLMDELCSKQPTGSPPSIVDLAVAEGDSMTGLMETVVGLARPEVLAGILDIFKQWRDSVICSEQGRKWIGVISRLVNSRKDEQVVRGEVHLEI